MSLSVCIFAHNEERTLPRAIGALGAAASGRDFTAHILVNGCTDETLRVAKALSSADLRITIHELAPADKANAWNRYVYDIAPSAGAHSTHVFLDGDITPSPGAFAALDDGLRRAPQAYGAGALPITGRSRRAWAKRLLLNRYLSGNLYALSANALAEIRARRIAMPFGAKGEDGILTYLLLTDLEAGPDDSHDERIINPVDATFEFRSLTFRPADFTLYHRRLKRYSERHFQKQILFALLKRQGLSAMPDAIADIYTKAALAKARARLDPVNFWYDRPMRKALAGHAPT